jgi:uncharacterized protein YciI
MTRKLILSVLLVTLLAVGLLSLSAAESREHTDAAAQSGKSGKQYFILIYTTEAAWKSKGMAEIPLGKHYAYVEKLVADKKLIVGGPFKDSSGAILIIQADDEKEARQIMDNEPLFIDKIVKAEMHPWNAAIKGCVE